MKKQCIYQVIPKGLLAGVLVTALSLLPGIAAAEVQVSILSNKDLINIGGNETENIGPDDDLGVIMALNGDGLYDVYAAYAKFGDDGSLGDLFFFDENNAIVQWDSNVALPAKLRGNVDLANSPVKDRTVSLLSKKLPAEHGFSAGTYALAVALSTSGQYDFPILEFIVINIQ